MRELTTNELKECCFQVLCSVRDVCEQNGLNYSLTGGTLLGSVRHKGFIPWDDDIDIMMPRADYDRFLEIARTRDCGFDILCAETCGEKFWYPYGKACCRGTLVKEKLVQESDISLGVFVDIFPVDGAGNTLFGAEMRTRFFQMIHGLKVMSNWTKFNRSKLRKWYYEPLRFVCYLLSRMVGCGRISRWLYCFLRGKRYEECAYAGRLVGDYGAREVMPRTLFENTIKLPFEGEYFQAVADYDYFLRRLYGDYMKLPPTEKQVTHHEFAAYWIEE